jgi:hypothetical protein
MTGLSWVNVAAGLWLIIAPWVLGYSTTVPKVNDVLLGAIVGVVALLVAVSRPSGTQG